jgi:hypothetical protein
MKISFRHRRYAIAFLFKVIDASEMFARAAKRGVFESQGRKKTGHVVGFISARRILKKSLSLWKREGTHTFP